MPQLNRRRPDKSRTRRQKLLTLTRQAQRRAVGRHRLPVTDAEDERCEAHIDVLCRTNPYM